MFLKSAVPAIHILLMCFTFRTQAQTKVNLNPDEFETGITQPGVQILDVRTQAEYNSGHLANSFLADWTNKKVFQERVEHLNKSKPIYVYCLVGGRSSAAAEWLRQNGFKEVYNLAGGIQAWKKGEKPVEAVQKVRQIALDEFSKSIAREQTVLVDIGAKWCPPCKKMEPVLQDLKQSHPEAFTLISIDGGEQESLARALNAESFPTIIIYKNGKEVWRKSGITTKQELLGQLQN